MSAKVLIKVLVKSRHRHKLYVKLASSTLMENEIEAHNASISIQCLTAENLADEGEDLMDIKFPNKRWFFG